MKYVVVLYDGMADYPVPALGGKTPMMCAKKPNMDFLAKRSEVGLIKTVADGLKPGSDVANMSVLGFDPMKYYTGRSPLEAASIGIDMKPFKTAEHICSWAGLCPGNNESAGKRKSASVTKGNPYIKSMLCEIAWVIAGKRNTYLSAWYWRIKQKKGAKKAIVALARKLLVIIYTMLKQGTLFDESCFETRRKNCEQKQLSRYIRELEKHGYHVEAQS